MKKGLDPKAGYARYAKEYDERQRYWGSFEQNALRPYIQESAGLKVLDAGAGTGRLSVKLYKAGANVTALDISPEMLALLKRKEPQVKCIEGDMEKMPFADGEFDRVFSSLAIVHLKDVEPFLDECYRVLKDGGILVLLNIHFRKPLTLKDDEGTYSIQCYNHIPKHLTKAAEELAFGIVEDRLLHEGDDVWVAQILVLRK